MSYDLYFSPQEELVLPEFIDFLGRSPNFSVSEKDTGNYQFWYENEDTGVYFSFDYAVNEDGDGGDYELSFNLNYNRPTFFALEAMPYVISLAKRFSLLVVDPQDHEIGGEGLPKEPNASDLITTWEKGNLIAIRAISNQQGQPPYFPKEKSLLIWKYQMSKAKVQESIGDDVFVPTLCLITTGNNSLSTAVLWPFGIPQVFPKCDYIIAMREKKNWFGRSKGNEKSLISYEQLLHNIGAYLEPFNTEIPDTKILNPSMAEHTQSFFNKLTYGKNNSYELLAMDSFVDIKPE